MPVLKCVSCSLTMCCFGRETRGTAGKATAEVQSVTRGRPKQAFWMQVTQPMLASIVSALVQGWLIVVLSGRVCTRK